MLAIVFMCGRGEKRKMCVESSLRVAHVMSDVKLGSMRIQSRLASEFACKNCM